jgi:hypothetical protein
MLNKVVGEVAADAKMNQLLWQFQLSSVGFSWA